MVGDVWGFNKRCWRDKGQIVLFFPVLFHSNEQTTKEQESKAAVVSDDKKLNCDMMPCPVFPLPPISAVALLKPGPSKKISCIMRTTHVYIYIYI